MMRQKVVTAQEIKQLDKVAIERYGISSLVLMENAGRAVAQEVVKILKGRRKPRVGIFCGSGNNGGDGFVAARHLVNLGIRVDIFLLGRAALTSDAAVNYRILKRCGYKIQERVKTAAIRQCDVIVDALFGVGLNRDVVDPFKTAIETINAAGKRVVAVDVPSGLDATSGKIHGVCVKASRTVTFSFPKTGFFKNKGPQVAGKIIVADIGIPKACH